MIPKAPSNFRLRNHIKQKGHVYTAQSLEELEKMLGIPGLAATVKEYNSYVANGGDPIGRNCLQGDMGKPVKIENPPFYAIKASGGMYFSSAGIKTNPQAQVLNWNGEGIPRLYVAGQTRGRFAVPYHLGHAMVFGYFAGQNAAREKLLS